MIKKNFVCGLISVFIMLCMPMFTVTFFNNENGMAIVIILFFVINPITSALIGAYAGRDIKAMWFQPLILAVSFIAGAWIFFEWLNTDFLMYAGIYLILGIIVMQISSVMRKK